MTGTDGALPVAASQREERMLGHRRPRLALRARPNWIGDGDGDGDGSGFWCRVARRGSRSGRTICYDTM